MLVLMTYIPRKVKALVKMAQTCISHQQLLISFNNNIFYYNLIIVGIFQYNSGGDLHCALDFPTNSLNRLRVYLILGCNIYVVGGICTQSGEAVDTIEVLDCETATWEEENEEEFRPVIGVACVLMPRL